MDLSEIIILHYLCIIVGKNLISVSFIIYSCLTEDSTGISPHENIRLLFLEAFLYSFLLNLKCLTISVIGRFLQIIGKFCVISMIFILLLSQLFFVLILALMAKESQTS